MLWGDNKSISFNLCVQCVDPSTIHRVATRFKDSGSVTKKAYPKNCRETKLTRSAELIILNMVLQMPGVYLREMQLPAFLSDMRHMYGIDVHESTLCKFLKKSGFTRQKMKVVAARQDRHLREMFAIDARLYMIQVC